MSVQAFKKRRKESRFFIHPLFFVAGLIACFFNQFPLFCISALVAVQHEYAHAYAAAKLGYRLNKIVLMPYGAVIDGDIENLSLKDEIAVAAAGPLANLCAALFFVAVWWLCPTVYAFTDVACFASLSVATVNLLPAYPLDGGRIFKCFLTRALENRGLPPTVVKRRANAISLAVTLSISVALFLIFAFLCVRKTYNFSLPFFALFLALGAIHSKKGERVGYVKIDFSYRDVLKRGAEIKQIAVLESCTIKRALSFLSCGTYLVLEVYDLNERFIGEITQNELSAFLLQTTVYTPVGEFFKRTGNSP